MATMWKVDLPGPLPKGLEAALQEGTAAMVVTVPEAWCYHVRRPAPPGGWTRRLREELRPGLFPEPPQELWWDEDLHVDGTWEVWAIAPSRVLDSIPSLRDAKGARARVCLEKHWGARPRLSAFPNLAPPKTRPMRWPWGRIRRALLWSLPPLAAALILGGLWVRQGRAMDRLARELQAARIRADRIQADLAREKGLLRAMDPAVGLGPEPFIADLDALTRLIPEDSRGVELRWQRDRITLDLITPKPEVVRDALEASPEFQKVHFEGNLDRRGDRSRLTLSLQPEVPR